MTEWYIAVDEETGDIDTLWNDIICPKLLEILETGPDEFSVYRVGDVEYERDRGGWTARDHNTGKLLNKAAYGYREAAVQAEQEALFNRMKEE
jgi:hypothetical protein